MSISMGSLGFLTPFSYDSYMTDIKRVLNGKHIYKFIHYNLCNCKYIVHIFIKINLRDSFYTWLKATCSIFIELYIILGGVSLTMRHRLECKVTSKDYVDQYHGEQCPLDVDEFNNPTVTSKFSALSLSPKLPTSIDSKRKETVLNKYLVS